MRFEYNIEPDIINWFRTFRNLVEAGCTDVNPDGFTAEEHLGDKICEELLRKAGFVPAEQWDTYGPDGTMRLRYWGSKKDARDAVNPDGFTAEQEDKMREKNALLLKAGWVSAGHCYSPDGTMCLLYWTSEEDARDDDGVRAIGEILKTPIRNTNQQ